MRTKLLISAAYLAIPCSALGLGASARLKVTGIGLAYYVVVSLAAPGLAHLLASGQLTRGSVLVATFFASVVVPGIILPDALSSMVLLIGCELALKMYSYVVETARPGARSLSRGEGLFFLLVDPTLLYTSRGKPLITDAGASGWQRAAGGAILMFSNLAFLEPLASYVRGHVTSSSNTRIVATMTLYGILRVLGIYAAHSSLASLDIGLMRQLGWVVPERYRFPLLASSPMDFWRRWNTYVRMWLEAYVFLPLARRIALRTKNPSTQLVAFLATLGASALIHDAFAFAARQRLMDLEAPSKFFLAALTLVPAWAAVKALCARTLPQLSTNASGVLRWCGSVCMFGMLVAAAIAWG